ncbi:Efflux pump himE [Cladobotryum mycophilum]|uniref:Efflux pump himE n=1 Tax=Cladobotryum mycophilum TaxID=491253 RepID=A0ABR0SCP8_9HYPO
MPKIRPPANITAFGKDGVCDLDTCPIEWSIYGYRPSLPANVVFAALFAVIGLVHFYLGFRWRSWGFTTGMLLGCITEVIGYVGRILLWNNPFSFPGFMIQIVCLTIAPVFYTASIYVTLSKTIVYLGSDLSRFKPQLFYWIFIPFDIVCLILQAAGGAMSSNSHGSNQAGINISMAGLALQVAVLTIFIATYADYMIRYLRSGRYNGFNWRFTTFFVGLSTSAVLILARCAYRVAELKDGYAGKLIAEEIPFIILEGVAIALAAIALYFGHPGLVFDRQDGQNRGKSMSEDSEGGTPPMAGTQGYPRYAPN